MEAIVRFDEGKERREFIRHRLAGRDEPVGDAAIEILPELLVEFGLRAVELKYRGIRFDIALHPRVGGVGYTPRAGSGAEGCDPLLEIALRRRRLAPCRQRAGEHRKAGSS